MKIMVKKMQLTLLIFSVGINVNLATAQTSKAGFFMNPASIFSRKGSNTEQEKEFSIKRLQPKAIQIIQLALSDSDPRIRANAIEIVAETRQVTLMPQVQKLLRDDFVPVRFAAAVAVGDTQYKLAKKTIEKLLNDTDTNTQIAASYAMIRLGSKADPYEKIISDALTDKNQTVRANATAILGKLGNKNDLFKLYWVLRDPDSKDMVRFQALDSIAMIGDEAIIQKIWPTIISSYNDDRVVGIRALGQLGTQKAKEIIMTKLDDDVLVVRLAAAAQLGKLNDQTGEEEVLKVFQNNLTSGLPKNEREVIDFFAALAIGEIATEPLMRNLPGFLENDSKEVRIAAAKAVLQCINKQ